MENFGDDQSVGKLEDDWFSGAYGVSTEGGALQTQLLTPPGGVGGAESTGKVAIFCGLLMLFAKNSWRRHLEPRTGSFDDGGVTWSRALEVSTSAFSPFHLAWGQLPYRGPAPEEWPGTFSLLNKLRRKGVLA